MMQYMICIMMDLKMQRQHNDRESILGQIIGEADKSDYIVLPISRVTQKQNLDLHYDFELQPLDYPLLSLKAISYVRTHKQTVLNKGELGNCIADFRSEYQDSYISVIALVEEFQNNLINKAF